MSFCVQPLMTSPWKDLIFLLTNEHESRVNIMSCSVVPQKVSLQMMIFFHPAHPLFKRGEPWLVSEPPAIGCQFAPPSWPSWKTPRHNINIYIEDNSEPCFIRIFEGPSGIEIKGMSLPTCFRKVLDSKAAGLSICYFQILPFITSTWNAIATTSCVINTV